MDHFLIRKSLYPNKRFSSHPAQLLEDSEVWDGSEREIARERKRERERERQREREGAPAFWRQLVGKAQNICLICFIF